MLLNMVCREFDTDATYGAVVSELELFSLPPPEGTMQALKAWRDSLRSACAAREASGKVDGKMAVSTTQEGAATSQAYGPGARLSRRFRGTPVRLAVDSSRENHSRKTTGAESVVNSGLIA